MQHGRSSLRASDVLRLATSGLRVRPMRVLLSALGIAIGVAALLTTVGIAASSQAKLNEEFSKLGTNLLTVAPGNSLTGEPTKLPVTATQQLRRVAGVDHASSIGKLKDVQIYKNRLIDPVNTLALFVAAADRDLMKTLDAHLSAGEWFTELADRYPEVVLGSKTAQRLGIDQPGVRVLIGSTEFTVIGILEPLKLTQELDSGAFVTPAMAKQHLDYDEHPTQLYERSSDELVEHVRSLIPRSILPNEPTQVTVSRPSDVLAAKQTTDKTLTATLLGLASVALLVGGIGVANTMIISVLERRREIGLRRALGARRRHIRTQFLAEAIVLSLIGGVMGIVFGTAVTAAVALANGWAIVVPIEAVATGAVTTIAVGAIAGLYPAIRAARMSPTEALAV